MSTIASSASISQDATTVRPTATGAKSGKAPMKRYVLLYQAEAGDVVENGTVVPLVCSTWGVLTENSTAHPSALVVATNAGISLRNSILNDTGYTGFQGHIKPSVKNTMSFAASTKLETEGADTSAASEESILTSRLPMRSWHMPTENGGYTYHSPDVQVGGDTELFVLGPSEGDFEKGYTFREFTGGNFPPDATSSLASRKLEISDSKIQDLKDRREQWLAAGGSDE